MWIGIGIGFGFGMTITTVMYSVLILRANSRNAKNGEIVEALLIRKAEACERMADSLEKKI